LEAETDITKLKAKALDSTVTAMAITDLEGKVLYANRAFAELWGLEEKDEPAGSLITDYLSDEAQSERILSAIKGRGDWQDEVELSNKRGKRREVSISATTITEDNKPVARTVSFDDITKIKEKAETITRQAKQLVEASTPIIEVWEGVLAAPLIGNLDTERTQRFMERLLKEIVDSESEVALIDITGVPDVDTRTAQHLIETVEAVKLLGAEVVLTGVSPSIAQSVVHLGIDLSDITTKTTLAEGLKHVFERQTPWELDD
jgi:PAS domain S-box-containing protein